jgi:NAD+ synthase (glutamine-hydrolysing)
MRHGGVYVYANH